MGANLVVNVATRAWVRGAAGLLWLMIGWASLFGCSSNDTPTEESLGAHFFGWLIIGVAAAIGSLPSMWKGRVPQWCRTAIVVSCAVATADVLVSYAIAICILGTTVASIEKSWIYIPAAIVTWATMIAAVGVLVTLVVALAATMRRAT